MLLSDVVYTWEQKSVVVLEFCTKYEKEQEVTDFVNNLGFSLYTMLSIYYRIATLEEWIEFKRMSSDKISVL